MSPLNPIDPDVDGDGVLDGADDQDHDDWTNIQERSRFDWPAASFAPLTGQPDLDNKYLAVNPYNPCLPNIKSRSLHPAPALRARRGRRSTAASAHPVLGYTAPAARAAP